MSCLLLLAGIGLSLGGEPGPTQPLSVVLPLAEALPPATCWLLLIVAGCGFALWALGEASDRMRRA